MPERYWKWILKMIHNSEINRLSSISPSILRLYLNDKFAFVHHGNVPARK